MKLKNLKKWINLLPMSGIVLSTYIVVSSVIVNSDIFSKATPPGMKLF